MLKIYPFKKNPTTQVILNKNIDKLINEIEVTKRPDSVNIFKQKVNVSTDYRWQQICGSHSCSELTCHSTFTRYLIKPFIL